MNISAFFLSTAFVVFWKHQSKTVDLNKSQHVHCIHFSGHVFAIQCVHPAFNLPIWNFQSSPSCILSDITADFIFSYPCLIWNQFQLMHWFLFNTYSEISLKIIFDVNLVTYYYLSVLPKNSLRVANNMYFSALFFIFHTEIFIFVRTRLQLKMYFKNKILSDLQPAPIYIKSISNSDKTISSFLFNPTMQVSFSRSNLETHLPSDKHRNVLWRKPRATGIQNHPHFVVKISLLLPPPQFCVTKPPQNYWEWKLQT